MESRWLTCEFLGVRESLGPRPRSGGFLEHHHLAEQLLEVRQLRLDVGVLLVARRFLSRLRPRRFPLHVDVRPNDRPNRLQQLLVSDWIVMARVAVVPVAVVLPVQLDHVERVAARLRLFVGDAVGRAVEELLAQQEAEFDVVGVDEVSVRWQFVQELFLKAAKGNERGCGKGERRPVITFSASK